MRPLSETEEANYVEMVRRVCAYIINLIETGQHGRGREALEGLEKLMRSHLRDGSWSHVPRSEVNDPVPEEDE